MERTTPFLSGGVGRPRSGIAGVRHWVQQGHSLSGGKWQSPPATESSWLNSSPHERARHFTSVSIGRSAALLLTADDQLRNFVQPVAEGHTHKQDCEKLI